MLKDPVRIDAGEARDVSSAGPAQTHRRLMTPSFAVVAALLVLAVLWLVGQDQQSARLESFKSDDRETVEPVQTSPSEKIAIELPPVEKVSAAPRPKAEFVATAKDILGTWVLDDGIRRVINNHPDGTATIHITFSYLTSFRYGEKLKLDLKWSLEDNVLTHEIINGTPEAGKKALIADFGGKSYFKVLNIADGKMDLVDFDDPPERYLWTRPGESPSVSAD